MEAWNGQIGRTSAFANAMDAALNAYVACMGGPGAACAVEFSNDVRRAVGYFVVNLSVTQLEYRIEGALDDLGDCWVIVGA